MESTTTTVQVTCTTYTNQGETIGEVFAIPTHDHTSYLAFAHDWDGYADRYDPLCCGAFNDEAWAVGEIERRARRSQAPATLPEIDGLTVAHGSRARWALHGSDGVHVLAARVGDTLIACTAGAPAGERPLLLIDNPDDGPHWFRVHDDNVGQAAELVVAALLNVASPAVAEEAAKAVPLRRVRLAVELVRAAIKEANPATGDFPALRKLLPVWE